VPFIIPIRMNFNIKKKQGRLYPGKRMRFELKPIIEIFFTFPVEIRTFKFNTMKKLVLFVLSSLMVSFVWGVKPALKKVEVIPEKPTVGDEVTIILTFSGNKEDVKSVRLYNVEFPYDAPVLELQPDPESEENTWKAVGMVPYEALAGVYNWEVKAIDKEDKEIVDKNCTNQTLGKTGKLSFEIQ